jgi:bacterioferritin-associated ferredoxin
VAGDLVDQVGTTKLVVHATTGSSAPSCWAWPGWHGDRSSTAGSIPADRRDCCWAFIGGMTGQRQAPVAEASPALIPDGAVLCQCNTVTKKALVDSWRAGARTLGEAVTATRAGTGCGGCRAAVVGIIMWLATSEGVPA